MLSDIPLCSLRFKPNYHGERQRPSKERIETQRARKSQRGRAVTKVTRSISESGWRCRSVMSIEHSPSLTLRVTAGKNPLTKTKFSTFAE